MDPSTVVDEVGEDSATRSVKLDSTGLRETQIAAFANHATSEIAAVHPDGIVGSILRIVVRL